MIAQHFLRFIGLVVATVWGLSASVLSASAVPSASAQGCPDVEAVFARGTGEPPGVDPTGQAFVDPLRSRAGAMSLEVYPVKESASDQWETGLEGIKDAGAHVVSPARNCARTTMVLGGGGCRAVDVGPATIPRPLQPQTKLV